MLEQAVRANTGAPSGRRNKPLASAMVWLLWVVCGLAVEVAAAPADPQPRSLDGSAREMGQAARAALARLANEGHGFGLSARLDAISPEIPLGARVAYRVESDRAASILLLHVDAHGVGTLLTPNGRAAAPHVEAKGSLAWPGEGAGFSLSAEPPIGREMVLVVASVEPLSGDSLGLRFESGPFVMLEAVDVQELVERIRGVLVRRPTDSWAATLVELRVLARSEGPALQAEEMVAYFTTRERAIRRPRLDLHVQFATGSAVLDEAARRNLDQVAEALRHPRLVEARFRVAGHTDSVGEDAFNEALSQARALSVVDYLSAERGLDVGRLVVAYHGERRPLEPNDTPEGRRMNRRVEFELIRD